MKKSYILAVAFIVVISMGGYALAQQGGMGGQGGIGGTTGAAPGYYGMMGGMMSGMMDGMMGGVDLQQMPSWCHGGQSTEEPGQGTSSAPGQGTTPRSKVK